MNNKKIQTHLEKSCYLINKILNDENADENKAKTKILKAISELETAREELKTILNELENAQSDNELTDMLSSSASGTIEIVGNGWLHLRIETILTSDKNHAEVKRVFNTITNLLDYYAGYLGYLPQYERVFVAIVEHVNSQNIKSYDHDNKGYRVIPNALKGRIFEDDNQFIMSLGLFTVKDENDSHCDIYVIPNEDIADFSAQFLIF